MGKNGKPVKGNVEQTLSRGPLQVSILPLTLGELRRGIVLGALSEAIQYYLGVCLGRVESGSPVLPLRTTVDAASLHRAPEIVNCIVRHTKA